LPAATKPTCLQLTSAINHQLSALITLSISRATVQDPKLVAEQTIGLYFNASFSPYMIVRKKIPFIPHAVCSVCLGSAVSFLGRQTSAARKQDDKPQ
jgi:hypothetical protein